MAAHAEEELLDYNDDEIEETAAAPKAADQGKKGYVGIHTSGFKDFMLKDELIRAITDCGFEHPSEVQHECIPQAILGTDVLCQAISGMGKTAVFVLSILQQIEAEADPNDCKVKAIVLCHTRELAFQIRNEFMRFTKYLPAVHNKVATLYGGMPIQKDKEMLKTNPPLIVVGTPPYSVATLLCTAGRYLVKRMNSLRIWKASSRVWQSTMAFTLQSLGSASASICCRMDSTKTAVLPMPEMAWHSTSVPRMACGMHSCWTSEGCSKPQSVMARMSSSLSMKSLKPEVWMPTYPFFPWSAALGAAAVSSISSSL